MMFAVLRGKTCNRHSQKKLAASKIALHSVACHSHFHTLRVWYCAVQSVWSGRVRCTSHVHDIPTFLKLMSQIRHRSYTAQALRNTCIVNEVGSQGRAAACFDSSAKAQEDLRHYLMADAKGTAPSRLASAFWLGGAARGVRSTRPSR